MRLLDPVALGPRTARNRVVFGPHETNLGRGRRISERHLAYYERRAQGGAGVIVVEEASVHESDWPYERCPAAWESASGWAAVASACRAAGALVLAALGHSGGQGSSAYSQSALWAPSRVPEVNSREVPKWMEEADIEAVIAGFGTAAAVAVEAGTDGVEVNAGQHSLIRQFLSGLTNQRDDRWGADKVLFARSVLASVRAATGPDAVVGLRLSCDELAPWAGIVPEAAEALAVELAPLVDYITVVRGSIFTVSATRPDGHTPPGFNLDLVEAIRARVAGETAVIAQGSIVDVAQAEDAVAEGRCDAVEMTRAQIADASLVVKLAGGHAERIRPCILCNQTCQVRDARNPIVSCVVDPDSGYEAAATPEGSVGRAATPRDVLVVGGGVAGLECARVSALRGHRVTLAEREPILGGAARVAAGGSGRSRLARIADWLEAECARLGVTVKAGWHVGPGDHPDVLCTGSRPGSPGYSVEGGVVIAAGAALALAGGGALEGLPPGHVAVWDPIGGPIGISIAEQLRAQGRDVSLVTPDLIAGNELSRSGDLAPANVRLLSAGVTIEKRSILRRVLATEVEVEDRFTGDRRRLPAAVVIDAGHRQPEDSLWHATGGVLPRAGDAVAPRTIYEAILEGRRVAAEL